MDREILFRAKIDPDAYSYDKKFEWVYGYYTKYSCIFSGRSVIEQENDDYAVLDETVCQYTGITDKNGTKIFEGDILHFGDKNYLVFWNDECFQWQMRIRKDGFSFPVYSGQDTGCPVECITLSWVAAEIPILGTMSTEIVGNIYDNPELIEE